MSSTACASAMATSESIAPAAASEPEIDPTDPSSIPGSSSANRGASRPDKCSARHASCRFPACAARPDVLNHRFRVVAVRAV